jgi:hypothetical protein
VFCGATEELLHLSLFDVCCDHRSILFCRYHRHQQSPSDGSLCLRTECCSRVPADSSRQSWSGVARRQSAGKFNFWRLFELTAQKKVKQKVRLTHQSRADAPEIKLPPGAHSWGYSPKTGRNLLSNGGLDPSCTLMINIFTQKC